MLDKYRPQFHFSPSRGWMNDPNGLIHIDGVYHLFFQHNPNGIDHADMHWGHAVSADLVTWQERQVALSPDALGTCFSGSAIAVGDGVKLFYTAHRDTPEGDLQVQCLVHADRALSAFDKHGENPVIDNPGLAAFRDPKVIWHEGSDSWIMVLTIGGQIGFYASSDLVAWEQVSTFGQDYLPDPSGLWECPDLIRMGDRWVLIAGLISGTYAGGSGTVYFIGDFDGRHFTAATPMLCLDYGRDFYAAQSFACDTAEDPLLIGWASNWDYARHTPAGSFRGTMSLPRRLSIAETPLGPRLRQRVPSIVARRFATGHAGTERIDHDLSLRDGGQAHIHLFNEAAPQFSVVRLGEKAVIRCLRPETIRNFGHNYTVTCDWPADGPLALTIFVDRGLVELITDDGLLWITSQFFPEDPAAPARLEICQKQEPSHV